MGVVHRDVKPSNIILERRPGATESGDGKALPSGRPMLMDFGLALRHDADATMTLEGDVLGTPAYMSPEQAAARATRSTRRSDVYSLGVVLYRLLTGELPFKGRNPRDHRPGAQRRAQAAPAAQPAVPRDLETICLKAMAKAPASRYATARELAEDLRRFLAGEPIKARPAFFWERTWRWARRRPAAARQWAWGASRHWRSLVWSWRWGIKHGCKPPLPRSNTSAGSPRNSGRSLSVSRRSQRNIERSAETNLNLNHLVDCRARAVGQQRVPHPATARRDPQTSTAAGSGITSTASATASCRRCAGIPTRSGGSTYSPDGRLIASAGWDRHGADLGRRKWRASSER